VIAMPDFKEGIGIVVETFEGRAEMISCVCPSQTVYAKSKTDTMRYTNVKL
jgi:hypothetical protein